MSFLKTIDIPGLTIPGNLFLAPLAGYSDAAFRSTCIQWGADLCYTEMVSAEGIVRDNEKTLELLHRGDNEKLFAVQIFVSDPATAAKAVRKLTVHRPDLFDLNCGCSVPKVLKGGCGAALLRVPYKITAILQAMREETERPVTVKLRSGWDQNSINYLDCAGAAEQGGAAMVCLHPRTRSQGFSGRARLDDLRVLKMHCTVPVIGSGDLFSPVDALKMFQASNCDGIMYARGALGNPFIFTATKKLLRGAREAAPASARLRLETALQQLRHTVELMGEQRACKEMRKHFCYYSKGITGGAELRALAVRARSIEDYENLVERFLHQDSFT
ncbi:MAG: tRNA dihydrouridine synthase DusB [Spirochaetaceae bacterium]|nr:MAG: tRNA dihydrouridine synthase DusB [Spirochaetaceae bacterium]